MSGIEICPARPEDAEGIQEVYYRSWLKTYPSEEYGITREDVEERFKDRNNPEKLAKRREGILHPPEGEALFVARDGGKVVGLVSPIVKADRNQLQRIYLLPEYERQGIGTRLWEAAQAHFDSQKDTYVEVAIYNEQAINFYKKLGFRDTGRRPFHEHFRTKDGTGIPLMELVLPAQS